MGNTPLSYTQKIKLERREKEFWKNYFPAGNLEDLPTHFNWIKLSFTDVNDEELGFLVHRIKSINMLDLKDTAITCEGIKHLIKLEYLRELRLKESSSINDDCMEYITQLTSLTLLQINHTNITVDGLKNIAALSNLKSLYLSLDLNDQKIQTALKEIQLQIPQCDIIVNGKDYEP